MLDAASQDVRYAIRALRSSPGFAAVAILSLGLGIGANTAIFSLIDAVMLKTIPVNHPEELLQVTMGEQVGFGNPTWEQIRDRQDVFSGIFGYGRWAFNLSRGGEGRNVNGAYVSGQYFDTLGVHALLGRTLTPADDRRGCVGTAVLNPGFWQREYGGSRDVIGKTISLDNRPFEIVGVAQPGFTGIDVGASVDLLVPLCTEKIIHSETSLLDNQTAWWIRIVGRPKAGVSANQATARLKTLAPGIIQETIPEDWRPREQYNRNFQPTFDTRSAANGLSALRDQYRQALFVLLATTGFILLIACANVANLLLARSAARQREIAIRMALGSGRGRLIRQLLTESLLLSGLGAALGYLFATWGAYLLVRYLDAVLDLTPDFRVLAFTAGVSILTGLLFGIAPAWRGTRVDPQVAMKANARGVVASSGRTFGIGKVLVMTQIALSLLLVVGAGLLISTFWKLTSLDPGFERDHVLLASLDLRNGKYALEQRLAVLVQILDQLRALPGVRSASASAITPMCGCRSSVDLLIADDTRPSKPVTVNFNRVSNGYFETLGTPIVAGRDFDRRDTPASPRVAIINQTMAAKYFGAENPLGKYYRYQQGDRLSPPVEIVGIVKDSKYGALREDIPPTMYAAWSQGGNLQLTTYLQLRTAPGAPTDVIAGMKQVIGEINPNVSLEFSTLATKVSESLSRERLLATLSGFFGILAIMLAMIGLYGVMSYNVTRRRNEIGIRMALGAEQSRVLKLVLGEVALLIGAGLVVGLGMAMAMTRFVTRFLYGLAPNDPLTLALAVAILAGVALVAGYLPARRASRQDPMTALREE